MSYVGNELFISSIVTYILKYKYDLIVQWVLQKVHCVRNFMRAHFVSVL